mmetsp:Transcript_35966/g.91931  ORF Transcript_35966/g.91931 Transcript_35966/m.91931 type:complete len:263 (-) Transcript_35966:692-1480(-)
MGPAAGPVAVAQQSDCLLGRTAAPLRHGSICGCLLPEWQGALVSQRGRGAVLRLGESCCLSGRPVAAGRNGPGRQVGRAGAASTLHAGHLVLQILNDLHKRGAPSRVLGAANAHQRREAGVGHVRRDGRQAQLAQRDAGNDGDRVRDLVVGPLAHEELPEHHPKGPYVALLRIRLPAQHLWRGILHGAKGALRAVGAVGGAVRHGAAEPKVAHLDLERGAHQQVGRLEVAVDDAREGGVQRQHAARHVHGHLDAHWQRQRHA